MNGRCCVLLMFLCPSVPAGVVAQAEGGAALCWRARPRPQCGAFVLTDAGAYSRLVKAASDEGPFAAVFDYGLMVNVTPHDAVGASFFSSIETNPAVGPAVRYRRWFDSNSSLDVALGVPTNGRQSGVFGLVKVNPTHWLGVALRPKLIRAYDYSNCPPFCAPVMQYYAASCSTNAIFSLRQARSRFSLHIAKGCLGFAHANIFASPSKR